ncbi:MAG: hypothetical protein IJG54_04015 [Bacteroidales bacterium]|nr:hypothetical protein [Bacteroidales bacterium]
MEEVFMLDPGRLYESVASYVKEHQGSDDGIDTSDRSRELVLANTYVYDEGAVHSSVEQIQAVRVHEGRLQILLGDGWQDVSESSERLDYGQTILTLACTIESFE